MDFFFKKNKGRWVVGYAIQQLPSTINSFILLFTWKSNHSENLYLAPYILSFSFLTLEV